MKKHRLHRVWLILAAYGVWYAFLSGLEDVFSGKLWKASIGLLLGVITYMIIESKKIKTD